MDTLTGYEGSSIKILEQNNEKNTVELSLVEENKKYSHYYNFIVENKLNSKGIIHISNITQSDYYSNEQSHAPYIKIDNQEWKKMSQSDYKMENNKLTLIIQPMTKAEISLVPRYVEKDLYDFIDRVKEKHAIERKNEVLPQIEIGNKTDPVIIVLGRQHPGETLSSKFIEGIIESAIKNKLRYHFIIFPIVNQLGVKTGNHRYTNNIDYNRSWNKDNPPQEIKYIKEIMKTNKPQYFVDVHNDEMTNKDYIRMNSNISEIAGIQVLKSMSKFRRFMRALIKQHKIINTKNLTSREYVERKYKCTSILVELSMGLEYSQIKEKGKKFIYELLEGGRK